MGKRTKSSKGKKRKPREPAQENKRQGSKTGSGGKYTVDQLLDKVEEYTDTFQYEIAQKFCQRALEMDAENVRVLETSGTLLLELGEMEKSKQCFGRAIAVNPEEGYSKYMYMGQLMTGSDALLCFHKGIDLMKKLIQNTDNAQQPAGACAEPETEEVSVRDISSAYCSMAEIYLTDECFKDEAEDKCLECLDNAVTEDSTNPEAHHLYASYWLSKDQEQKAKESLSRGLSLWLPQWRDMCEKGEEEVDPLQTCPLNYPARINVTKMLVELKDFNTANEILELLLDEDDAVVETWYLLGWINYLQGDDFKQNARYYLGKAQKLSIQTEVKDAQITSHLEELLTELGGPVEDDPDDVPDESGEGMELPSDSEEEADQETQQMDH